MSDKVLDRFSKMTKTALTPVCPLVWLSPCLFVSTPHSSNYLGSECSNIPVGLEQRVPMQLVFHVAL